MKLLLSATSLLALAACAEGVGNFHREAGSFITDDFGNSTMNNTQIMNGDKQWVDGLANRFASAVTTTVNFAFNSATLDAQAQATLMQQADFIRQFPEVRFRVYGHTDLVGSNGYNYQLGLRRANAVVAFLARQGISKSRLEALVSYGETQPLIVSQGRERQNRRTVTEVSGFVANNPMVLDGKYAQIVYRDYVASAVAPTQLTGTLGQSGGGGGGE